MNGEADMTAIQGARKRRKDSRAGSVQLVDLDSASTSIARAEQGALAAAGTPRRRSFPVPPLTEAEFVELIRCLNSSGKRATCVED